MASDTGTFGITGIIPPKDVEYKTDPANNIPYVTGMPLRYELTEFFERMMKTNDAIMQKQWTLFVIGLEHFKSLKIHEKLSYFQVAGIHGSPEQPWDGAKAPRSAPTDPTPGENPYGGYCHHNTIAFPTWHRPYLLLFEQCIWLNMKGVVDRWVADGTLTQTDASSWISAASTWRLFYWDWARKQKYPDDANPDVKSWNDFGIPYLFSVSSVPVFLPKGRDQWANPLWNFENPEKDPTTGKPFPFGQMPEGKEKWNIPDDPVKPDPTQPWAVALPWSKCTSTSRWGLLYDETTKQYSGLEGRNEWKFCNTALSTAGARLYNPSSKLSNEEWAKIRPGNLADAVNRMFSTDYNGKWTTFASTKWYAEDEADVRTGYLSLEYIHNNIHNITGGSSLGLHVGDDPKNPTPPDISGIYGAGQMCDVPVAAFDPIFWMHHCNIDRYTAMWQCLNWGKWFEKEPSPPPGGSHVEDVKPETPLEPFHLKEGGNPSDPDNIWTSNLARDWTKHGYQYDDLMPKPNAIDASGKLIADTYKSDLQEYIHTTYPGTSYQAWAIRETSRIDNADFFGPKTAEARAFEDYLINVVYDRYALNGKSYAIEFTLSGDYVGQIYSLGGMKPGTEVGCANCGNQQNAQILSKGQVPIAIPLMRKAANPNFTALNTFTAETVEEYLAQNLQVQYIGAGGKVRPASEFPNTKISVFAGKAIWSQDEKDGQTVWRPPYYDTNTYRVLYKATEHLEGGAKAGLGDVPAGFMDNAPLDEVPVAKTAPAA